MKDAIKRICELQPHYSFQNTPEMQERGAALRRRLKPAIERMEPSLAEALVEFGGELFVEASDGIGRKTELPWVRFSSRRMSPNPREGFYCVIHFSTDGSAVHVTVGCGASRFQNGEFVVLPDDQLDSQTEWARNVVMEALGTLEPFTDSHDFGASRELPRSFERATAFCKRIGYGEIDEADIGIILEEASSRLLWIYRAQALGRDVSLADQLESEVAAAIMSPKSGRCQGFGLSAAQRRAVEERAMDLAEAWLLDNGYAVRDCSATSPYDFEATLGGQTLKVEVKGTTSDRMDGILMTRNEVDLHRKEQGATALFLASQIRLSESDGKFAGTDGSLEVLLGWDLNEWRQEPTTFRLTRVLPNEPH